MKEHCPRTCPGCRKHCPECNLRCKYGKAYFEKKHKSQAKWEAYVTKDSLAWELLNTGRRIKKGLRKGFLTEDHLFARLTETDRQMLIQLLEKLNNGIAEE